jgi:hypothetical protein
MLRRFVAERRAALEDVAAEVAGERERQLAARKELAAATRALKQQQPPQGGGGAGGVLRAYQGEIDALTSRCQRLESVLMGEYSALANAPKDEEPAADGSSVTAAAAAATIGSLQERVALLEKELERYRRDADRAREEATVREARAATLAEATLFEMQKSAQLRERDWQRREAELVRERDAAVKRENAAKRERDALNTSVTPEAPDEEDEKESMMVRQLEARLLEAGAGLAKARAEVSQEARRAKEALHQLEELRERVFGLEQKVEESKNALVKAQEESAMMQQQVREERRQASAVLAAREEQLGGQLRGATAALALARADAGAARALYKPVATPIVVASSAATAGTTGGRMDVIGQLLRYRPVRLALMSYLALVHILLFIVLYSRALPK